MVMPMPAAQLHDVRTWRRRAQARPVELEEPPCTLCSASALTALVTVQTAVRASCNTLAELHDTWLVQAR
jgi:hypothetical protein